MASLMKQKTTLHVDSQGNRVKSTTPGAKRVTIESKKWYATGVPGWPKGKRIPLATSKSVSERMLAKLVEDAERGAAGMSTVQPKHQQLEPLIEEFSELLGLKANPKHTKDVTRDVRRVMTACKLTTVADLNAPDVVSRTERFVWGLVKEMTPANAAVIGKHARQFTRWLWIKKKILPSDPLAALDLPSNATVNKRRALTEDELRRLLTAARESKWTFRGTTGTDRELIYSLAVTTGFRIEEISVLEAQHFDLDNNPPMILLPGTETKNKDEAYQPIARQLTRQLSELCASRRKGYLWPGTWWEKGAKMIRHDLTDAGITHTNDAGKLDFHALRHTFTTMLGRIAPPKVVQELARHSTPMLTVNRYSHAELEEKARAVNALPIGETVVVADPEKLRDFLTALALCLFTPLFTPPCRTNAN